MRNCRKSKSKVGNEEILPALRNQIAAERDKMSLLPSISSELAASHRHRRFRYDSSLLSVQDVLVALPVINKRDRLRLVSFHS